ncbi:ankyrin [Colletotrichum zoysiae]|uniref:Ankyrin n=1 Tax=Colletotrichum zoysiae TaxID=1216348 RepID=A0AAD9LVM1_9PEZI|nr:ankyrin [Colletotrichum zoysiae]
MTKAVNIVVDSVSNKTTSLKWFNARSRRNASARGGLYLIKAQICPGGPLIRCSRKLCNQLDGTLYHGDASTGLSVLWATARGDAAALRKALRLGVSVHAQWPRKWRSPWKETCLAKWLAFTKKVKGYTALQVAAVLGHTHLIEILVSAGADIDAITVCCWRSRKTPLHLALCHRNWSMAETIVRHGSSLTVDGPDGPQDVLDWVDHSGPNVRNLSALHDLSCHWTPGSGVCDFAGWLVTQAGLDVNASTDQGMTPLAAACAAGQFKLAHRLLSLGADCSVVVPTRPTETLLHIALRACTDMGMRRLAVNTGGDEYWLYLLGRDEAFDTLPELVQQLINNGVAVDATDANQRTALHAAVAVGELGLVELLLRSGANPEMRDVFGATPLDLAKRQSPLLTPARWCRRPGFGPSSSPITGNDIGYVAARYRPLLTATEAARSLDSDLAHLTDQAGRVVFELGEIRTPYAASTLRQQYWVVIDGHNPILEHLPYAISSCRGGEPSLGIALSGVSAVFWAATGRPQVVLKLRTYDFHVKALRKHIVRVEFQNDHNKTRFLRFVLPFVLTVQEKQRSFIYQAWREGTIDSLRGPIAPALDRSSLNTPSSRTELDAKKSFRIPSYYLFLPPEILLMLLRKLDRPSVSRAMRMNKSWFRCGSEILWRKTGIRRIAVLDMAPHRAQLYVNLIVTFVDFGSEFLHQESVRQIVSRLKELHFPKLAALQGLCVESGYEISLLKHLARAAPGLNTIEVKTWSENGSMLTVLSRFTALTRIDMDFVYSGPRAVDELEV